MTQWNKRSYECSSLQYVSKLHNCLSFVRTRKVLGIQIPALFNLLFYFIFFDYVCYLTFVCHLTANWLIPYTICACIKAGVMLFMLNLCFHFITVLCLIYITYICNYPYIEISKVVCVLCEPIFVLDTCFVILICIM